MFVIHAEAFIRKCDWLARTVGDSFMIVLPDTTEAGAMTGEMPLIKARLDTSSDTVHPPSQGAPTTSVATPARAEATSLANIFLKRTRDDLLRLSHIVARARQGETAAVREIGQLTHSIRGTGAMFDYPGISAAAACIETWASQAVANGFSGAGIDDAPLEQLLAFMRRLAQETDRAARTTK